MRSMLIALALVAGCSPSPSESITPDEYPMIEPTEDGSEVVVDPAAYQHPQISELGTDELRPIAKTVEFPAISTAAGTTYLEDAVVVDQIRREDGDNSYGVRVRLKNATDQLLKCEYQVYFLTRNGPIGPGYKQGWKGFILEPYRNETVGDFSPVTGAEGFRLAVRAQGTTTEGPPDDPAKKEERQAERERKKAEAAAAAREKK